MSKITNDGLTRSGTGCFISVPTVHGVMEVIACVVNCNSVHRLCLKLYTNDYHCFVDNLQDITMIILSNTDMLGLSGTRQFSCTI